VSVTDLLDFDNHFKYWWKSNLNLNQTFLNNILGRKRSYSTIIISKHRYHGFVVGFVSNPTHGNVASRG